MFSILKKDNNIIYSDRLIDNYIKELEDRIKDYDNITNIGDCINSSVIYRNPMTWYDSFTINKGVDDVKENDLVITNDGVVGVITSVYHDSSEVSMITNPKLNITVSIKNDDNYVYGIITGYDKVNKLIIASELTSNIDSGVVLTSEFSKNYKGGLIIGEVYDTYKNNDGLSYIARIKPIVNYNNIRYVCVIK